MTEIIIPNRKYETVISRLEANPDGISLLPDGSIPDLKDGCIVSVTNNAVREISPTVIDTVLSQVRKSRCASLIGGWFSDETNQFFVDASAIVRDIEQAIKLATMHDQEAIYDIAKNSCIYLR